MSTHQVIHRLPSIPRLVIAVVLLGSVAIADDAISIREVRFEPNDESRSRVVPLKVYIGNSRTPQPVVLFSHGLGGSRENNAYLGKHWAAAGYVAVFMQHAGSDDEVLKSARAGQKLAALKAAVSAIASRERFADVPFVIDQLEQWNKQVGHELQGKLNLTRIGMSGHSYGAATTLAVAGQTFPLNRSFHDQRIDAFLAMSPQPGKGQEPKKAFGHIAKPFLCMTGTKDASPIDPTLKPSTRREVYAAFPAGDKYQLVFDGAEHLAFGDSRGLRTRGRNPKHHPAIQEISVHFWNAYLKDDATSKSWLQSNRAVTTTGLGTADVWEWK
ncbi:MAG: acetylhydrolase [Planctomycetota bacterium]|nr:acetylhydrolase [Planctomycetota bacterium]